MAKSIGVADILGESVISDVPILNKNTPLTDDTKMYLDIEQTFRQIPLSRLFDWLKGKITQLIYPIGSVYMTFEEVQPSSMFGGTWEKIEGMYLLGASASYPVGTEGGNNQIALTTDNLPSHSHAGTTAGTSLTTSGTSLTTSTDSHSHSPYKSGYNFTVNTNIGDTSNQVARRQMEYTGKSGYWAMTTITNMDNIHQSSITSVASHNHTIGAHTHTVDAHTHTFSTSATGNSSPVNIMPKYKSVYVWRRIG